jgi:hypothetical protein
MPTPTKSPTNLHIFYMYGQPLGVECPSCRCRTLAFADRDLDAFRADMRELRTLRFVCSSCDSRDWTGWLFVDATEREAWREGLVMSPIGPGGPTF